MNEPFPSQTPWKCDWQRWYRLGLIAFLLGFSAWAQADENNPAPPVTDLSLELPSLETQAAEETPVPEELPALSPLPPTPEMKNVPPGQPLRPESAEAEEKPAELLPLPDSSKAGNSSESQIGSDSLPAKPDTVKSAASWTMLITPGASSQAGTPPTPKLVTFEIDEKTGAVRGDPQEQVLGYEAAARKIKEMTPAPPQAAEAVPAPQGYFPAELERHPISKDYSQVYNSIPFSRAEYLANPAYRHEATIELMFGEMRPTTIQKNDTPRRIYNLPALDESPRTPYAPYSYGSPFRWTSPWGYPGGYFPGRYPYWTPNSTYRVSPTMYGPLFNYYYRPAGLPRGGM